MEPDASSASGRKPWLFGSAIKVASATTIQTRRSRRLSVVRVSTGRRHSGGEVGNRVRWTAKEFLPTMENMEHEASCL